MEKKVDSFAVFAKIILYNTIFFKKFFMGNIQKMSIEGSSDKPGPCNFLEEVRAHNEVRREATPCGDVWGM